jgi:hypothetical protein
MLHHLLFLLCLTASLSAGSLQERTLSCKSLRDLASSLGIPPDADLLQETQKRWLRPKDQERFELSARLSPREKNLVLSFAKQEHFLRDWEPKEQTYDTAFILGGTISSMRKRILYLKSLWEKGVRFQKIVLLTGKRPLDPKIESDLKNCFDESDAALFLWNEMDLPSELKQLELLRIAVPMNGSIRPNTEDTLLAYLLVDPSPCKALFISSQPICYYQYWVVNTTLPSSFDFDLVGPASTFEEYPAAEEVILDSLARAIYQESLSKKDP